MGGLDPGVRWWAPDHPTIPPGSPGGPLYLNFVGGRLGADGYIHAYLMRR